MNKVDKMKNNVQNAFILQLSGVGQYKNEKELYIRKNTTIEMVSSSEFILRRYFNKNKLRQIKHYKNYLLDGQVTEWFYNGEKMLDATYKDGKRDGCYIEWKTRYTYGYGNKVVKYRETFYTYGRINGTDTMWHDNGRKLVERTYSNGKYISAIAWHEGGQVCPGLQVAVVDRAGMQRQEQLGPLEPG